MSGWASRFNTGRVYLPTAGDLRTSVERMDWASATALGDDDTIDDEVMVVESPSSKTATASTSNNKAPSNEASIMGEDRMKRALALQAQEEEDDEVEVLDKNQIGKSNNNINNNDAANNNSNAAAGGVIPKTTAKPANSTKITPHSKATTTPTTSTITPLSRPQLLYSHFEGYDIFRISYTPTTTAEAAKSNTMRLWGLTLHNLSKLFPVELHTIFPGGYKACTTVYVVAENSLAERLGLVRDDVLCWVNSNESDEANPCADGGGIAGRDHMRLFTFAEFEAHLSRIQVGRPLTFCIARRKGSSQSSESSELKRPLEAVSSSSISTSKPSEEEGQVLPSPPKQARLTEPTPRTATVTTAAATATAVTAGAAAAAAAATGTSTSTVSSPNRSAFAPYKSPNAPAAVAVAAAASNQGGSATASSSKAVTASATKATSAATTAKSQSQPSTQVSSSSAAKPVTGDVTKSAAAATKKPTTNAVKPSVAAAGAGATSKVATTAATKATTAVTKTASSATAPSAARPQQPAAVASKNRAVAPPAAAPAVAAVVPAVGAAVAAAAPNGAQGGGAAAAVAAALARGVPANAAVPPARAAVNANANAPVAALVHVIENVEGDPEWENRGLEVCMAKLEKARAENKRLLKKHYELFKEIQEMCDTLALASDDDTRAMMGRTQPINKIRPPSRNDSDLESKWYTWYVRVYNQNARIRTEIGRQEEKVKALLHVKADLAESDEKEAARQRREDKLKRELEALQMEAAKLEEEKSAEAKKMAELRKAAMASILGK